MPKRRISKMTKPLPSFLAGDTLIEIMFAVGIFGLVAVGSIGIMNRGLYDAQRSLEVSMARNEIDAQAEALRFIHEAYIAERRIEQKTYTDVWEELTKPSHVYNSTDINRALPNHFFSDYTAENTCESIYESDAVPSESFVVNTRRLDGEIVGTSTCSRGVNGDCLIVKKEETLSVRPLETTPVHPRILYGAATYTEGEYDGSDEALSDATINGNFVQSAFQYLNIQKAQGIWVTTVASSTDVEPEFYDFYIRTCWQAPGVNSPVTISSTIRLFNPDYITNVGP